MLQVPLESIDQLIAGKPVVSRTLNALVSSRDEARDAAFERVNAGGELSADVRPAETRRSARTGKAGVR